uniref:Uncharacterized protein n=1 Tax=Nelumbo nucifera TaxID=4432 RepID=A0A822YB24_NELNU|nr:TPA_asm: hypothetical protein HUJ06_029693 [Nelumbo nucifera]
MARPHAARIERAWTEAELAKSRIWGELLELGQVIGYRGRLLGSKLECQKAQLLLLLRQKSPI